MPLLLALALLLSAVCVQAEDLALVRIGEAWRYLKGVTEPSAVPLGWTSDSFDDSAWSSALSSFSSNDLFPETTILNDYGQGYTTLYFRKSFMVQSPAAVAQLVLRIDYNDGFIAYLNGIEICRRGVAGAPNSPVPFNALASYHSRGYTEEIDISPSIPLLKPGANLLAIQLLGSWPRDTVFCVVAELRSNFTRAPFVQNTTSNSVQIISKTLTPAATSIDVGLTESDSKRFVVDQASTNHVATVTNLIPATEYKYRVNAFLAGKEVSTDWATFKTFATEGPVHFQVMGDSGWATVGQLSIADRLRQSPADLLMHVGDLVYYGFSQYACDFRCFSVYADFMRSRPVFVALGNHENYVDRLAVLDTLYLPTNTVTGTEHYYSFDHGDVHFLAAWADLQAGANYALGSPEYNWIEQDLAATKKPWKFIFFHHVLRSSSFHGQDDYDFNRVLDSAQLQASIGALASKYGVQIIFNGHDHDYERFAPLNGPLSFVTGGGGAALYLLDLYEPTSVQYWSRFHYLDLAVTKEEAVVQALDPSGVAFDTVHVRRDFPPRKPYSSAWHTPALAAGPADDGDGNVTGQRFDYTGEPVPSKPGNFSSAGRLFVNNDARNVYFGMEELALGNSHSLFLFIETPNKPGIKTMAGFGNGVSDPDHEGVDGLDFLENLSFTNFVPSIGVVIGDEMADGPFRSFVRNGMGVDLGQGAYYLQPGIPEVAGQRLQQYNHSPQSTPFPYEENANFIELAIPYSALGVHPGETIKVGAIVGLNGIDPGAQTRELDSGGVAYAIWTDGATTWLEGVPVQLAVGPPALSISVEANGAFRLSWNSVPGQKYQVQYTSDLERPFQNLQGATLTATGYDLSYPLTENAAGPRGFYRIVLVP